MATTASSSSTRCRSVLDLRFPLKGSSTGDIDIGIDIDVDMDVDFDKAVLVDSGSIPRVRALLFWGLC